MPVKRRIMGVDFEIIAPSHYRAILPNVPGHTMEFDLSYVGPLTWLQHVRLDQEIQTKPYTTLEDAARPLAIALGRI